MTQEKDLHMHHVQGPALPVDGVHEGVHGVHRRAMVGCIRIKLKIIGTEFE